MQELQYHKEYGSISNELQVKLAAIGNQQMDFAFLI
jgi:hypothetical protein